jgi:hypothetical protein
MTKVTITKDYFTMTTKVRLTELKRWFNTVKDNHGDGVIRQYKMTDSDWESLFNYLKEDSEVYGTDMSEESYVSEIMSDWISMELLSKLYK